MSVLLEIFRCAHVEVMSGLIPVMAMEQGPKPGRRKRRYFLPFQWLLFVIARVLLHSHGREVGPLRHLQGALCHHQVVWLPWVVWDTKLAHLNLRVTESTVRDACVAQPVRAGREWRWQHFSQVAS